MPSTRDILRRIKSVKSTAQVTRAMQMVASSKMGKAQAAALAGRPYALLMNQVLGELLPHLGDFVHPLMERREARKRAVIVVTTDKGLCGALNSNLMRETARFDPATTEYVAAGKKGAQALGRAKLNLIAEFHYKDSPSSSEARAITKLAIKSFLEGEVDEVQVLFSQFVNTLTQKPRVIQLLPIQEIKALRAGVGEEKTEALRALPSGASEFKFEPDAPTVLGTLLPHWVNFIMYQVLHEAKASEQSARMVAMKNATENADQLVKDLTLDYNKLRQSNITKELLEIASAQMAMG